MVNECRDFPTAANRLRNEKPPLPGRFFGYLDDLLADAGENFRMVGGELSEDLAVEGKTGLLELRDECGVGLVAGLADSGVQPNDPDLAEVGLFVAAVGERVAASAHERFVRVAFLLRADAAVALGAFENVLAAFLRHYSSFDSCHTKMITERLIT